MKKIIFFVLIAATVIACGSSTDDKSSASSRASAKATPVASKPDGEKIYKTYCVTCHGTKGNMGASGAANLQESQLALEERITVITNGRNTMTAFKSLLNEEKIKAVAEYTLKLKKEE
jgi:mono/diheme cytochrome c family protein